jgi:hypothetical protein
MATPKRKPAPKRPQSRLLLKMESALAVKPAARLEVTQRGQQQLADSRRATDAELTAVLHAAAKDFNRALTNAVKAGLIVLAELTPPQASNDDAPQDGVLLQEPVQIVQPPLVRLDHIGRKYL